MSPISSTLGGFNPRPRTGSDLFTVVPEAIPACFNPRPRTGSDLGLTYDAEWSIVSIHAPARGATRHHGRRLTITLVAGGFNPRPRTGSDLPPRRRPKRMWVSIHAPHGERPSTAMMNWWTKSFNPRPRTGSDAQGATGEAHHRSFNPRPRTGSDRLGYVEEEDEDEVSIHAPARGATVSIDHDFVFALVSIHAPARGATR